MNIERYNQIIEIICKYNGIEYKELNKINRYKQYRYILLLLLRKYNCTDKNEVLKYLNLKSSNSYNNNYRKAQDKLLINKNFREQYFEMEKIVEEKIK